MDGYNLSPARAAFVEHEVATGGYADVDEYVGKLIDAAAQDRLEQQLLDGLGTDELEWTPDLLEQVRRDAHLTG